MIKLSSAIVTLAITAVCGVCEISLADDLQLTFAPYTHSLDNNDNFSPNDEWIAYDRRTAEGGIGAGKSIEKVNVCTKEIVTIYDAPNPADTGPGIGAVSYHPTQNKVLFIHGLVSHTEARPYALWRRFGMLVDEADPSQAASIDARDVVAPFTPGALRGGTHRHEFSGDGKWIGFTYNDAIMGAKGEQFNLRTIGVTQLDRPVTINGTSDGANFNGTGTSALVVRVTPNPRPGSDDVSRAAYDSWIGTYGYKKPSGRLQRARAFLGTVYSLTGKEVMELFVVDIPDDLTIPGHYGPLEGTAEEMPMPCAGVGQRRLTHTTDSQYPGFTGNVRSSPDGSTLACLAKDTNGVGQVVLASPLGGPIRQLTSFETAVQSDVRWHPNGRHVCFVQGDALVIVDVTNGNTKPLTKPTSASPYALVWSRSGKTIAFNRDIPDEKSGQSFAQVFVVDLNQGDLP
jgi:hypothetical protein